MTRTQLVVVLFAVLAGSPTAAAGQALHLITIADTNDVTIGEGAKQNSLDVAKFVTGTAQSLGLTLKRTTVQGADFKCGKIIAALSSAVGAIGANDTVVFYYSGHGFRPPTETSAFPSFFCALSGPYPSLAAVSKQLAQKARLTIAIADTCNVVMPEQPAAGVPPPPSAAAPRTLQLQNLFVKSSGTLVFSSSKPGEFSWYLPTGGFFTRRLLASLDSATSAGEPGLWSVVDARATTEIKIPMPDGQKILQHPISDLSQLSQPKP
jgi:hypothetical protein